MEQLLVEELKKKKISVKERSVLRKKIEEAKRAEERASNHLAKTGLVLGLRGGGGGNGIALGAIL